MKTLTWKALATALTFSVSYIYTGQFYFSAALALTSLVAGLVMYYLHERLWNAVQWGRHHK